MLSSKKSIAGIRVAEPERHGWIDALGFLPALTAELGKRDTSTLVTLQPAVGQAQLPD